MDCKCKDFKCAKDCKCPFQSQSVMVLEDMLNEMLCISGLSQDDSSNDSFFVNVDDYQKEIQEESPCFNEGFLQNSNEEFEESSCQVVDLGAVDEECAEYSDENCIPVNKNMFNNGNVYEQQLNDTLIEDVPPPCNLYDTYHDLEVESEPDRKGQSLKSNLERYIKKGGIQRKGDKITTVEEAKAALSGFDPVQSSKTIDASLKQLLEFRNRKSPEKIAYWSNYIKEVGFPKKRTTEDAMNEIVDQWADYSQKKRMKCRKKKIPPNCDVMLGDQKVYPPERYVS